MYGVLVHSLENLYFPQSEQGLAPFSSDFHGSTVLKLLWNYLLNKLESYATIQFWEFMLWIYHTLTCGSIMRGQRSELERIVAFSVDIRSEGSPSLFHMAIWASSVSRVRASSPSVMGTGGYNKIKMLTQDRLSDTFFASSADWCVTTNNSVTGI